jgi:hypothetical protein
VTARRVVLCGALLGSPLAGMGRFPTQAAAQAREPSATIASDRPGLGDGAHVLAPGVWQAELGVSVDGGGGVRLYSIGQGVLRFGLAPVEVRVYPNSYVFRRGDGPSERGLQDPAIGVKVPVGGPDGDVRAAVVAGLTLPVGSNAFTADDATGFSTLVLERSLSESVGLAVNAGYSFRFDDLGDGTLALIVTPGFPIGGSDSLSGYGGWAGFFGSGDDRHVLEAGLAYLADADVQLDLNGGWDPDADAWFLGVGIAMRRR